MMPNDYLQIITIFKIVQSSIMNYTTQTEYFHTEPFNLTTDKSLLTELESSESIQSDMPSTSNISNEFMVPTIVLNTVRVGEIEINKNNSNITTLQSRTKECKMSRAGEDYDGTVSTAVTGDVCSRWVFNKEFTPADFPNNNIDESWNFCRNPDNDINGPWCNVLNYRGEYEYLYCTIPMCDAQPPGPECKYTTRGEEYRGTLNHSMYGDVCMSWHILDPDGSIYDVSKFPDRSIDEALNYCRNPDSDVLGPWCMSQDQQG